MGSDSLQIYDYHKEHNRLRNCFIHFLPSPFILLLQSAMVSSLLTLTLLIE